MEWNRKKTRKRGRQKDRGKKRILLERILENKTKIRYFNWMYTNRRNKTGWMSVSFAFAFDDRENTSLVWRKTKKTKHIWSVSLLPGQNYCELFLFAFRFDPSTHTFSPIKRRKTTVSMGKRDQKENNYMRTKKFVWIVCLRWRWPMHHRKRYDSNGNRNKKA